MSDKRTDHRITLKSMVALLTVISMIMTILLSGCTVPADTTPTQDPSSPTENAGSDTTEAPTDAHTGDPSDPTPEDPEKTPENTSGDKTLEPGTTPTPTPDPSQSETPAGATETQSGGEESTEEATAESGTTPTPTAESGSTPTPTPAPGTPTPPPASSDNVFDRWDNSVKAAIGTLKQTIVEMTSEGVKFKDERNGSTSGASGDPFVTLNVAKYSQLTGKTALTGAQGSYIVFKVKSADTDGDFEVFTQTPKVGDTYKSQYIQNGEWQYIFVDMTATTLVKQTNLSTIRIDWASTFIKPTGWMIISEIAFYSDKAAALSHAGIPADTSQPGIMTENVTFPSNTSASQFIVLDSGTATLKKDGNVNAIEIVPSGKSLKVTLDVRAAAALQKSSASQKRYLAIKMKTVGNGAATVTMIDYADLMGNLKAVETKGDLSTNETGWQGIYFDLNNLHTSHASVMKIDLRLQGLTAKTGKILIGGLVFTDDLNTALDACGLGKYKLNTSGVSYNDPLAWSTLTATNQDTSVNVWFSHSTEKLTKDVSWANGQSGYTINMGKNETENAQYFVVPSKNMKVKVTVDNFTDGNGHTLVPEVAYEYYHNLAWVMRPDALIPMTDAIDVSAWQSQGFIIRVTTKSDTPAGTYTSAVHVYDGNGNEVRRSPIAVKVYNFALTDETTLRTAFALWPNYVSNSYPANGDGYTDRNAWNNLYYTYYEFFFKYRINIMDIPLSGMTSGKGVSYMSSPQVNTARWSNNTYSVWQDLQNDGYTEKPAWLKKIIYYPGEADEPRENAHFAALKNAATAVAASYPEYRMVVPIERDLWLNASDQIVNKSSDAVIDSVGYVMKYTNIYCPKMDAFTPRELSRRAGASFLQSLEQDEKYGTYMERAQAGVKNGAELWSYICINPTQPYVNWQINNDGTEPIVSLWQAKMLGVTGMLYWAVDYWNTSYWRTSEPWEHSSNGDGMLIYSGHIIRSLEPIPSIRLEQIRDGIEDYQMLCMLEKKLGTQAVNDMISKVCTSVVTYTDNDDYLHAVRVQLLAAVENAYK